MLLTDGKDHDEMKRMIVVLMMAVGYNAISTIK